MRAVIIGQLVDFVRHIDDGLLGVQCFLSVEKQGAEIAKAERHTAHDALSGVAGEEQLVGILATTDKGEELRLCEILSFIDIYLIK